MLGEIEVEKHRLAVGGQQDVGRFDVPVKHAAHVRVLQSFGQTCDQPRRGLNIRAPAQRLERIIWLSPAGRLSRAVRTGQLRAPPHVGLWTLIRASIN